MTGVRPRVPARRTDGPRPAHELGWPPGSLFTEKAHVMKKMILSLACLCLLACSAPAGVVLSTSNPAGTPLSMIAGSTSGSMLVNVVSDNPPNDVMAAWNVTLEIVPEAGAHRYADLPGSRDRDARQPTQLHLRR